MPHIEFMAGVPGIRGPMLFSPETASPINALANMLLRTNATLPDQTLSMGERELIGTYTSALNDCHFCQTIHGAIASHHLGDADWSLIEAVKCDYEQTDLSPKLKALLAIAASTQQGGKHVTNEQVAAARAAGATDRDIHDTVLIAAFFCLCNRYVDGLATLTHHDETLYRQRAAHVAEAGYIDGETYIIPQL
jgi:uncharacterized peroxidase-related enzyme